MQLPFFELKMRNSGNREEIWCPVRKKFLRLTPEEFVRQTLIRYLQEEKGYPIGFMSVEKTLIINNMRKRYDLVVFSREGKEVLLAECKAPGIPVGDEALHQMANYNREVRADILILTNGASLIVLCRTEGVNFRREEDVPGWK